MEIPDDVFARRVKFEDAAPDANRIGWDALPARKVSIDFGSNWASSEISANLDVPSIVIPEERNYLINATDPDSASNLAVKQRRYDYDSRLR